jgi:ribose transport system substrate-binding protein
MKRLISLLLGAVMVFGLLAGCTKDEPAATAAPAANQTQAVQKKDPKDIVIGVSMYTMGAPYFAAQGDAAVKAGEEIGCTVIVTEAQDNMNKQLSDVEDLLAQNIDVLILNPKDPVGAVPATKAATAAGVPVIIIDSSIDPSADYVTTVQSDNKANGVLVGEFLAKEMKGTPIKMALMSGSQGNPVGEERRQGVLRGVIEEQLRSEGQSSLTIVGQGWGNWGNEGGLSAMEDLLVANPDINVLVGENDSMLLGAMKAIEAAGKTDQIKIYAAADGQKEGYLEIKKGGQYRATGLNDPALVASTAVDIAIRLMNGETDFPKISYTPPACITQDNVDEFYREDAVF